MSSFLGTISSITTSVSTSRYTLGVDWPTGQQQKKKSGFHSWNHVVFPRATISSFHLVEGSYRSWDVHNWPTEMVSKKRKVA